MDERVERAMQQWPDVPDVYGWLSLDARGRWKLRGEPITNPNLIDFINRNYDRNEDGSYAFQNGPQRVHVALEATPWVAFLRDSDAPTAQFELHTGSTVNQLERAYLNSQTGLVLDLAAGPALLCDQDLLAVLPFLRDSSGQALSDSDLEQSLNQPQQAGLKLHSQQGLIALQNLPDEALENVFGFVAQPRARR